MLKAHMELMSATQLAVKLAESTGVGDYWWCARAASDSGPEGQGTHGSLSLLAPCLLQT
jgi:hypothetical protein